MTAKIKISPEIDSAAFEAFKKKFDEHKSILDALPGASKDVANSAKAAHSEFASGADALAKQAASAGEITSSVTKLTHVSQALDRHWHSMRLNTAGVASNIGNMTDSLLKWGGIISKVTVGAALGAAGAGAAGFWGMDKLGHGVMDKRMRAQGLGTSIGGMQSFNTAYGRLGNTEGMLGAANTAKSSISSHERQALVNLGISPADIDRLPSDELAALMVQKVQLDALGVPMSHEDMNRIRGTSDAELGGLEKRRRADKPGMEISDSDAKKWTDFVNKVAEVAKTIENKFTVKLSSLADPLSHLSDGVGKLADTFIEKDLGPWIDGLAEGLESLNKVVAGEGFKGVTKAFMDDMKLAAEATAKLVHGLASAAQASGKAQWARV
jgi:hypothetical protein